MAVDTKTIKESYPLPVYNYRVSIGGASVGFSEVSGLNIKVETTTYKESKTSESGAGVNTMHMPMQGTPVNVTLKKGLVKTKNMPVFYDWINSIKLNQVAKQDIVVSLCDEDGNPVVNWTLSNAFPVNLDAPSFDATSNDVAIESLEVMCDGLAMS